VQALPAYQPGRWVICCDENTGLQGLARPAPTTPAQPGKRERRAYEDMRHGTRVLSNSLVVATGQSAWTIGATRKRPDVVAPLQQVYQCLPRLKRSDWRMANLHPHWSLEVCRLVARGCKVPFECQRRPETVCKRPE
jgi:hypothetical protein